MKKIRLIQVGEEDKTYLSNTTITLNQIQDEFIFEASYKTIKPKCVKGRKYLSDEALFKQISIYMGSNGFNEYPIAITEDPLVDELISVSDESAAIISLDPITKHSKKKIDLGLMYTIASILPDINHQVTNVHDDTRGCPNDFCDNLEDIDIGLENCKYCKECHDRLLEAIEKGNLNIKELAATLKILDHIVKRKICFVIMPFDSKMNKLYDKIKKIFEELNYECYRADEIYENRNIIELVNERIIRANTIIAVLTNKNPNVFYELGYAHAFGKNTILMAKDLDDIPFNLSHRHSIIYKEREDYETFRKKILKHISF